MRSKLISSRDSVPSVPLTPWRASVRRNLSSRKVARSSRYSDPGRADQLPGHRLRSLCGRPSKIDHRRIVVRTCRIVSCRALVTCQRRMASGRSAGRQRFGRRSRGRRLVQGCISGGVRNTYVRQQLNDQNACHSLWIPATRCHHTTDWAVASAHNGISNKSNGFNFESVLSFFWPALFSVTCSINQSIFMVKFSLILAAEFFLTVWIPFLLEPHDVDANFGWQHDRAVT